MFLKPKSLTWSKHHNYQINIKILWQNYLCETQKSHDNN